VGDVVLFHCLNRVLRLHCRPAGEFNPRNDRRILIEIGPTKPTIEQSAPQAKGSNPGKDEGLFICVLFVSGVVWNRKDIVHNAACCKTCVDLRFRVQWERVPQERYWYAMVVDGAPRPDSRFEFTTKF